MENAVQVKQETLDDINFNYEVLHHSIDIKEEPLDPDGITEICKPISINIELTEEYCNVKDEAVEDIEFHSEDLQHSNYIKDINLNVGSTTEIEPQLLIYSEPETAFLGAKSKTKPYMCEVCGLKCTKRGDLIQHIRTHTGEKPFACSICDFRSARNTHLRSHLKTHTGEKPFTCEMCIYKCSSKELLKHHMVTHSGEKPFVCDICDYKFSTKEGLKRHTKTHTGEKSFACELLCNYKCSRRYDLKRHMRTHTGEKPFACEICDFKSTRKANLKQHMKTHPSVPL